MKKKLTVKTEEEVVKTPEVVEPTVETVEVVAQAAVEPVDAGWPPPSPTE